MSGTATGAAGTDRALVLGGGGVAGIGWAAGLLAGLARHGVSLADADLVVGTSAGSVVGAWLTTGVDPEVMLAKQVDASHQTPELAATADLTALMEQFAGAFGAGTPQEVRAAVGHLALETPTVDEQARRDVIAGRLPVHDWPTGLLVTVVDALTGARLALDASCGAPLVDVVAASCAVPGVWPPMTLELSTPDVAAPGPRRYVDGGVHTVLNADLAAGARRVLVLAPLGLAGDGPLGAGWDDARPLLGEQVLVLEADERSRAAFGSNPLDPATRRPSAEAGLAQADDVVAQVRALWQ